MKSRTTREEAAGKGSLKVRSATYALVTEVSRAQTASRTVAKNQLAFPLPTSCQLFARKGSKVWLFFKNS